MIALMLDRKYGFALKRSLLLVELIILCGPAIFLLGFGLIYLPTALTAAFFSSKSDPWVVAFIMIVSGLWGTISLANLARHVYFRREWWPGRKTQWLGILLGLGGCAFGAFSSANNPVILLIFIGPVIATLHLLYVSKSGVIRHS